MHPIDEINDIQHQNLMNFEDPGSTSHENVPESCYMWFIARVQTPGYIDQNHSMNFLDNKKILDSG
jgi:hypothetical protein